MRSGLLLSAVVCLGFGASYTWANLVQNGDFSANASGYTTYPGYSGGSNPASPTNWTSTRTSNSGVNGAGTGAGNVFGPANTTTDSSGNPIGAFGFQQVAGDSLSQAITFAPNTTYALTFDAAARNNYGIVALDVIVNDGSGSVYDTRTGSGVAGAASTISTSTLTFVPYTVQFTTTSAATAGSLSFLNSGGQNDSTIDITNVSIVPEPASLGLVALGGVLLTVRRRRV